MLEEYVVVDLEMTGLRVKTDRILEIGAVKVSGHKIAETYQTLVDPRMELSEEITALTGITSELAATGNTEEEAVGGFLEFCGSLPLVGHNIMFDYSFLKQYAVNHGIPFEKEAVDTLKLSRKFLPGAEKKTLDYLCTYLGIQREQRHRALEDAKAEMDLLEYLLEQFSVQHPKDFVPVPLTCKLKKQSPVTKAQKKQLKELAEYHKIELTLEMESLTRNQASRMIDRIIAQYGRKLPPGRNGGGRKENISRHPASPG